MTKSKKVNSIKKVETKDAPKKEPKTLEKATKEELNEEYVLLSERRMQLQQAVNEINARLQAVRQELANKNKPKAE